MKSGVLFLVQTPYYEDYGPMRRAAGTYFPLGIGYIAAKVKAHGYDTCFFDTNVQDITLEDIALSVKREKPVLVGVSFMTPQFFSALKLCRAIKEHSPETLIVLGGAHSSVMPQRTLEEIPDANFIIVGEGEESTVELLNALAQGKHDFSGVKGLAWRNNGRIMFNGFREPIRDLDGLPFPDRSLIDQSLYRAQSFLSHSTKAGTVYTSRGCPGRCVFCASGYKLRSQVRERSIENVMAEIDFLRAQYDIDYLLIKDDTFTMRKARVEEFCRAFRERHPGMKWHCMVRVNTIGYELLATMQEAGLHDIFIGIESGNRSMLLSRHAPGSGSALTGLSL